MSQQADSHAVIVAGDIEPEVHQAVLQLDGPAGLKGFPGIVMITDREGRILEATEAAAALRAGLQEDASGLLAGLVIRAQDEGPLYEPVSLSDGTPYDLAILPLGRGGALVIGRCSSIERNLRDALIDSRQRYKDFVECSSDFAWETDAEGSFTFVSTQGALGYSAAELVGARAQYLQIEQGGQDSPFVTQVPLRDVEVWLRAADGEPACVLATALPLTDQHGAWCGARGLCRNITAERSHAAELAGDRHRERLLSYILGIVRDEMEPARMFTAAAGALVPALPAAGACIYRPDRDGALTCAAQAGVLPPPELLDPVLRKIADQDTEDEIEVTEACGTLLAKAARFTDERRGVLCVWRAGRTGPWDQSDRYLLGEIAAQIGLAGRQLARQEELEELSSTDALTGLLLDPLEIYPGGEMPDMALDEQEASAIAAYILSRNEGQPKDETVASFVPEPERIARGKVHFTDLGRVNCHRVGMVDQLVGGLPGVGLSVPHHQVRADTQFGTAAGLLELLPHGVEPGLGVLQGLDPVQGNVGLAARESIGAG